MMLKEESGVGGSGTNNWARVCDTCQAAACTVYCRADSAYLCSGCDARVHAANRVASRHERVWVCEACERAPAAFFCKADAASLCATCDSDIHLVNPLARRHTRVPILPISSNSPFSPHLGDGTESELIDEDDDDEDQTESWLLLNNNNNNTKTENGLLSVGGVDEYLVDLVEYNNNGDQYNYDEQCGVVKSYAGDSVVPVQSRDVKDHQLQQQLQYQNFQLGLDFGSPNAAYGYNDGSSHSVSISSMEVGVVPDSAMSDISNPRPLKGTVDLNSGPPMPTQLSPMEREARVLRYREKKKTRKFEKTIRYASRKAYAETRPRIKGRFAKRTDVEIEVDQMFSTAMMAETGYGLVPSF